MRQDKFDKIRDYIVIYLAIMLSVIVSFWLCSLSYYLIVELINI